jgi:hypothetical protein
MCSLRTHLLYPYSAEPNVYVAYLQDVTEQDVIHARQLEDKRGLSAVRLVQ